MKTKFPTQEIIALYQTGEHNMSGLAKRFGCSLGTIRNILIANNITPRRNWGGTSKVRHGLTRLSPEQEIKLCEKYIEHNGTNYVYTILLLAEEFGISRATIVHIVRRNNYPVRTHGGNKRTKNLPLGQAPLCKCGCNEPVSWSQAENHWYKYVQGHYDPTISINEVNARYGHDGLYVRPSKSRRPRKPKLYDDPGWLFQQYHVQHKSLKEVGETAGVCRSTISKAMKRHNIPRRTTSQSLILRGSMNGSKNPAWKGGVAQWEYSSDWKRLCKQIKDRDHWQCQLCLKVRKRWGHHLHVHHIDEDKTNDSPLNLISLCDKCHASVHGDEELRVILLHQVLSIAS